MSEDKTEGQLTNKSLTPRQRLTLLNQMSQRLTTSLNPRQIVEHLLPAAAEISGAGGALLWLLEEAPEACLVCRAAFHRGHVHFPVNLRLRPGRGIACWVAQQGASAIVSDVQQAPQFSPAVDRKVGFARKSLLAVPLHARGKMIGVLEIVNKVEGEFSEDDRTLIEMLVAPAALALDSARLAETLHQRTVDLQTAYEKQDTLARTLADDIRGPLGLIVSFAQVLEEDYTTLSSDELYHYLHTMSQRGRNMVNIVDDLLAARPKPTTEIEEEIGPLDMAAVVAGALERLIHLVREHQAQIILPDVWPAALGYGPWVEEVWVNYLSNAIRYGDRPPKVTLGAAEQTGGMVRFWVRDNGPGLAPEEQVRLLSPVTPLEQVRAAGYGLGLALVRRIVEKLGGQIGLESEIGQGSLFFFTLPAAG
jgi:signal transduction histidine kinase